MGQDLGAKTYRLDCKMIKTYEKIILVFDKTPVRL